MWFYYFWLSTMTTQKSDYARFGLPSMWERVDRQLGFKHTSVNYVSFRGTYIFPFEVLRAEQNRVFIYLCPTSPAWFVRWMRISPHESCAARWLSNQPVSVVFFRDRANGKQEKSAFLEFSHCIVAVLKCSNLVET